MWIDVALDQFSATKMRPKVWIAVDVLRASSVMTTFLAEGGVKLYMTGSVQEAYTLQRQMNLLAMGERFGRQIEGFEFDNSPMGLLRAKDTLAGRSGVHCSTNGTKLVKLLMGFGGLVIGGCFLNLSAVTLMAVRRLNEGSVPAPDWASLQEEQSDGAVNADRDGIVVACAGNATLPLLDDTYLAGALVDRLAELLPQAKLRDGARIAQAVRKALPVKEAFRNSNSGIVLTGLGLQDDISFCARQDVYSLVPEASSEGDRVVMKAAVNGGCGAQTEVVKAGQS
jgi:2-phosphosulfolactate phosphatase